MNWTLAIVISLLVGIIIALIVYRKDQSKIDRSKVWVSPLLRGLTTSMLVLLLLSPYFTQSSTYEERPSLALLLDKSTSVLAHFSSEKEMEQAVNKLQEKLSQKYNVTTYAIGDGIRKDSVWSTQYKLSDLSNSLYLFQHEVSTNAPSQAIMVSDGIYNVGADPSEQNFTTPYSIHALVVGDTTLPKDALVKNVLVNKIVPYQSSFECLIDVAAYQLAGEMLSVDVMHRGTVVHHSAHAIKEQQAVVSIPLLLKANQKGVQQYSVVIATVGQESNVENNKYDFFVEVLDEVIKVAIVASAPHPDVVTIQRALKELPQFEVIVRNQLSSSDLLSHDVIIAHNPEVALSQVLVQAHKPSWFILGSKTAPAVYQNLGINVTARSVTDISPLVNQSFGLFQLSDQLGAIINKFPPLQGALINAMPGGQSVFYQKIGAINTENPLWVFKELPQQKIAILNGEGIWRWATAEQRWTDKRTVVHHLIKQTVQQLYHQKKDKALLIYTDKKQYSTYESIAAYGLFKNEMGEVINDPTVTLTITPSSDTKKSVDMERVGNSYKSMLGLLEVGNYVVHGSTVHNGISYSSSAPITVVDFDLEQLRTHADYALLHRLATESGGSTRLWAQWDQLAEELLAAPAAATIIKEKKTESHLINEVWYLVTIVLLWCLDWFFRKNFHV